MSENDNRIIEVEYEINGQKFKGRGHPDDVNPHTALFASMVAPTTEHGVVQLKMPEAFVKGDDAPLLSDKSASNGNAHDSLSANKESLGNISNTDDNASRKTELADLIEVYLRLTLKSQREELLFITHFYTERMGYEFVTMDNYRAAYDVLADIPVSEPSNYAARLQENVDDELMRCLSRGVYKLTIKGKREVESWLNSESE